MEIHDGEMFAEILNATTEYYGKPQLSDLVTEMYFNGLAAYSIDQFKHAVSRHMADTKNGQFMPKVADLIRHIEGGEITHDQILGAARLANTPLGILCRIQIGTFDLEKQTDMFYLKQRAEECLLKLPEWKNKALSGDYSDHEVSIMLKHSVNPCAPFFLGLPAPRNQAALRSRIELIKETPRHKFLLESKPDLEDHKEHLKKTGQIAVFLEKILNE